MEEMEPERSVEDANACMHETGLKYLKASA